MKQRAPLTQGEKRLISQKKAAGESLVEISRALQCSYETVRKWWRMSAISASRGTRGRPNADLPGSAMPPWEGILTEEQRLQVLSFVTTQLVKDRKFTDKESESSDHSPAWYDQTCWSRLKRVLRRVLS